MADMSFLLSLASKIGTPRQRQNICGSTMLGFVRRISPVRVWMSLSSASAAIGGKRMHINVIVNMAHASEKEQKVILNSLTAIDGHDHQYFNELRSTVVSR